MFSGRKCPHKTHFSIYFPESQPIFWEKMSAQNSLQHLFACKPAYFLGENVHTKLTSACISLQGRIFEWCSYGLVNTTCKVKQHHFSLAVWLNLYKIYRKKYPLLLMLFSVCRNTYIHNTEVLYCHRYSLYDGIRLPVGKAKIPHRDALILKGENKNSVSSQTSRIQYKTREMGLLYSLFTHLSDESHTTQNWGNGFTVFLIIIHTSQT